MATCMVCGRELSTDGTCPFCESLIGGGGNSPAQSENDNPDTPLKKPLPLDITHCCSFVKGNGYGYIDDPREVRLTPPCEDEDDMRILYGTTDRHLVCDCISCDSCVKVWAAYCLTGVKPKRTPKEFNDERLSASSKIWGMWDDYVTEGM